MIDWHCHILPQMDDGSSDVAESISLLQMQAEQGVRTVVATPHFYANDESVESFLARREEAYGNLKEALTKELPEVILGTEVHYYRGISRMLNLKDLCIQNSKILLLEMPMGRWSEDMILELIEMSSMSGFRLVLAHIDRYWSLQKAKVWKRLYECGILMQVNASIFGAFSTKRKAISLLRDGGIHFIGTDCHNTTTRKPDIKVAFDLIVKKMGNDYLFQMNEFGYSMFGKKTVTIY